MDIADGIGSPLWRLMDNLMKSYNISIRGLFSLAMKDQIQHSIKFNQSDYCSWDISSFAIVLKYSSLIRAIRALSGQILRNATKEFESIQIKFFSNR